MPCLRELHWFIVWTQAPQAHKEQTINLRKRHALCDVVLSFERNRWGFKHVLRNSAVDGRLTTINILNYEPSTRKINRIYSHLVRPSWLVALSAVFKACFAVIVIPVLRRSDEHINGQYKMQTTDRRPGTKCGLSTKYRLQTGYKMQTENLNCFFVWYVITCHLTTYQASRNRFSVIIFHYHLHYRGIFLAHFLISFVFNKAATIVLNRISSIHMVWFSRINICVVTKYMRDKTARKVDKWPVTKATLRFSLSKLVGSSCKPMTI